MGFKKINRYHLINAGVMTGTTTLTSAAQNIENFDNTGLHVIWTGTPTGVFSVLCSIDNVTYDALTFNPALAQPAGSASSYLVNLNQVPFPYIKARYVNASGTGVLHVWLNSKDLN